MIVETIIDSVLINLDIFSGLLHVTYYTLIVYKTQFQISCKK